MFLDRRGRESDESKISFIHLKKKKSYEEK